VLLVLAVVSTLLLPVLEVEGRDRRIRLRRPHLRRCGEMAALLAVRAALLALGFASGFIHYLLDRAAFRFSSPDVRQAARGLLQSRSFHQ
jgi:hypothetical protein